MNEDLVCTEAQKRAIKYVRNWIERHEVYSEVCEFKRWEIERLGDTNMLVLYVTTGVKNDEGTYASIICRKSWQIFIGPRGGLECYVQKKRGKGDKKLFGEDVLKYGAQK